ncbi:AsmA family protein [Magnetospirillum sp. UT-4]|uniref:AsmA family protein n=1 Tax=Magnetospirillum sp. UT-4 TaxID=2681467 RepID=UPI00138513FB|nr:AsmA family protein [Magnetospirillum sp. UT-4]CAA7626614.1 conserved exported hypothetical protein [Magnetospirillum sp. UT-4]
MKKLLIALAALAAVVVAALVVLPSLVPADRIKQEVVAQVKAATGRDLTIDGKVSVSAFPSLSVQVSNVALSNPPGFSSKDLVRLGALDVQLKLIPILSGRVEVDSFVLVDPLINLEVDRQGRANWVFDTPGAKTEAKPAAKPADSGGGGGGGAGLGDVALGDVRISNGRLVYVDAKAGTKEEVDAVDLTLTLKNLDSPLAAKGSAKWHGKTIDLSLGVAKPRAVMEGGTSPVEIAIGAETVKLSFKGDATGGKAAGAKGELDLSVPSIRNLVQWATTKPLDAPGTGLGPFSLKGMLAAGGTKVSLSQAAIAIDSIKANGDFAVDTGGARPALKGRLDIDTLDLNPYLPPEGQAKAGGGGASSPAPAGGGGAAKSDWSDDAIDASGLKAADVDFALSVGAIKVKKIQVGKSALTLDIANGRMVADLTQLSLYQGAGKGRLAVDGSQPGIGLDAAFNLKGLAAEPFLTDSAGFDRLSGTGNFDVQVTGRGKSERQLVSSLDGKGALAFLNGAIKGINLGEMVRNVATAFTGTGGAQKTDFAELGGTFTITDGIVSNKDLALKSPLLRVEGAGTVELPPRTIHYRIEPKAVASLEGQGGKSDVAGLAVPVIVEGPWDNLSYRPDLAAMVKGQAGQAIQGALQGKGGAVGGALGGLLGGGSGSGSSGGQQQQQQPQQKQNQGPLPLNPGALFGR